MSVVLLVLMAAAMLAVLVSLGMGLYHMGREGDADRRKSNDWMRRRVILQGVALVLFALSALSAGYR